MSMSDLQMKIAAEAAYIAANKQLANLQDFAHTYSEAEATKGASILVPVYDLSASAEFDADTNNYASGVDETGTAEITLNKHYVKSVAATDRDLVETETQFFKNAGEGIATVLGRAINGAVVGMLNATNIDLSATVTDLATKSAVANLYSIADTNGLNVPQTVVMLKPALFAKVLSLLDASVYGGIEAVQTGRIPGLYGFKAVVCAGNLDSSVNGVMLEDTAVGIASRYLPPMTGAYPAVWKSVDPSTGFTLGFRQFCDLNTGVNFIAGEALFGAKIINKDRIVKFVAS